MDDKIIMVKLESGYAPGKVSRARWNAVARALEKLYELYAKGQHFMMPGNDAVLELMEAYDEWLD